jgi:H+/Cl- antiporter ClcA
MSYSLVVIMMETFDSFDLFIPFVIANGVAKWIASLFT